MKTLFNSFIVLLIITSVSCSDTETLVNQVMNDTKNGATLKTLVWEKDLSLAADLTKFIKYKLAVTDEFSNSTTKEIRCYIQISTASANLTPEVLLRTYTPSDFVLETFQIPGTASETNVFKVLNTEITLANVQATFPNLQYNTTAGRRAWVRFELELEDGRIFTNTNTQGPVSTGGFFNSQFRYNNPFRP
jgi:hypothetical protein